MIIIVYKDFLCIEHINIITGDRTLQRTFEKGWIHFKVGLYLKFARIHFNIISYICREMNAKQKSQVLSKSNISQLREVDDVKGGKVERNFHQSTSVGEDRCLTLIRLPSNSPAKQPIHSTLHFPNRYIRDSPQPMNILQHLFHSK